MTSEQFNNKYFQYLEPRFYGCSILNPELIDYLDKEFLEFIKLPGFSYKQIKQKFNFFCFYCENVPMAKIAEVEANLKKINEKWPKIKD